MTYLNAVTRTRGYLMSDCEPPKHGRHCQHGFVPAEQYVREMALTVNLADAAAWHVAAESKRPARCIVQMIGAYQSPKDRVNPLLRKRQNMQAIS